MSINALRLHADTDAAFLAARRSDPVAARPFVAGDLVVVCASCQTPLLAETWVILGGAHCGQTSTADRLPSMTAAPAQAASSSGTATAVGTVRKPTTATSTAETSGGRAIFWPAALLVAVLAAGALTFFLWPSSNRSAGASGGDGTLAADFLGSAPAPADPSQAAYTAPTDSEEPVQAVPMPGNSGAMTGYSVTAAVNSPGDGFLALRSEPSVRRGRRLARIPHGATIGIADACEHFDTVGGQEGAWCLVDYQGQIGWAFSAYLDLPPSGI